MRHRRKECTPLTIQSETPACSGHPNLSEPSSSCKRWDSPDCRRIHRHSVTGCKDCHSVLSHCSAVNLQKVIKCSIQFLPCAEHIFVEGTLTTLALSPQAREAFLQCVQVKDLQCITKCQKSQQKLGGVSVSQIRQTS